MKGLKLHPACQVREESFGLLFYDSRGPRLLFAETGKLFTPEFFNSIGSWEDLPVDLSKQQQKVLKNFINTLQKKGFLYEQ